MVVNDVFSYTLSCTFSSSREQLPAKDMMRISSPIFTAIAIALFSADRGDGSAYPTGCVSVCNDRIGLIFSTGTVSGSGIRREISSRRRWVLNLENFRLSLRRGLSFQQSLSSCWNKVCISLPCLRPTKLMPNVRQLLCSHVDIARRKDSSVAKSFIDGETA